MSEDEEYETRISIDMAGQGHIVKVKKSIIEMWNKKEVKDNE